MARDIEKNYLDAKEKYTELGIDTDSVLDTLKDIPVSVPCWQGDDISGFENPGTSLEGGGILVTGSHPGKPRNIDEFRADAEKAFSLIPGSKKFALQAIHGDFPDGLKNRSKVDICHFESWVDWAKENNCGLDFNPTLFSHDMAKTGYTLSDDDKNIRDFWIDHVQNTRKICDFIGRELKTPCYNNIWLADGSKDETASKLRHRENLIKSLDEIFSKKYPDENMQDSLESKLFGIGLESYTVGSNEFYISYAIKNDLQITLDTGHFHPTEKVSDKISALIPFIKGLQLHVTRGVRWDSDHVPLLSDELIAIMQEIVRADALNKVSIGTDYFDASISRIGAWVIGARSVRKALLIALLEPTKILDDYEKQGNNFARLAFLENLKFMPHGSIWDHYCSISGVSGDSQFIEDVNEYEKSVISKR